MKVTVCLLLIVILSGCNSEVVVKNQPVEETVGLEQLAKTDIDNVIDIHIVECQALLRELMLKLYKRNPREIKKAELRMAEEHVVRLFDLEHDWDFPEFEGKHDIEVIKLAFDEDYNGDRVFVFVGGLLSMIMKSYDYKSEFFIFDSIDPQKLYNSARNIEIAVWRLGNNRDSHDELFIYSNSLPGEEVNLSYERLFGKLIATQDNIASVIASKQNRTLKTIIQRVATAAFIPI